MSDTYGDEPLKYLSQTPQRQRDEIHRLQGEVETLHRERDAEKEKARVLRVENNTVRMDLAAMTAELAEWKTACEQKTEIMQSHSDERQELQRQVLALTQERDAYQHTCHNIADELAAMTAERDTYKQLASNCGLLEDQVRTSYDIAASQAYAAQLREALKWLESALSSHIKVYGFSQNANAILDTCKRTLALSSDDTALKQYGAKLLREWVAKIMANGCTSAVTNMSRMADELEGGK